MPSVSRSQESRGLTVHIWKGLGETLRLSWAKMSPSMRSALLVAPGDVRQQSKPSATRKEETRTGGMILLASSLSCLNKSTQLIRPYSTTPHPLCSARNGEHGGAKLRALQNEWWTSTANKILSYADNNDMHNFYDAFTKTCMAQETFQSLH